MNDDRLLLEMRRWLQEERVVLPDAEEAGQQIASRLPTTRQRRRRRWRLPSVARTPEPPSTRDTTEFQPDPAPANNGHTPTLIGRTTSMLSPVKAITAGAIVFAIGGAFLITQPFQQSGSVPGADAPSEPPIEFTGRLVFGPQTVFGTEEQGDGRTEIRGHVFRTPVSEMSDERLDGEWTRTNNLDQYDEPSVWTWQAMWRVENDDGAWEGLETPIVFSDGSRSTTTSILVGEGDYNGLVAVTEFALNGDAWDLRGVIIDGEMPPAPEPANAQ